MKYTLTPYRTVSLTNAETAELINRHLTDIDELGTGVITDPIVAHYTTQLSNELPTFRKALMQIQRNAETDKIADADAARDKAVINVSSM